MTLELLKEKNIMLNTEIIEKSAKQNNQVYSTMDFAEIQKERMMGQLYSQVSDFYKKRIDNKEYNIGFGYYNEGNTEYAHAGIWDNYGEQIL